MMSSSEGNAATAAPATAAAAAAASAAPASSSRPNYFVPADSASAVHHHHHPGAPSRRRTGGRRRRKSGELWKLPEASIRGYADWIESKPPDTRTLGEQKFLQKYQWRLLVRQHKMPTESMKQYIRRLEASGPSEVELQLIEAFYRKRASRRAARGGGSSKCTLGKKPPASPLASRPPLHPQNNPNDAEESVVFWSRPKPQKAPPTKVNPNAAPSSPSSSMSILWMNNLQASMSKMGLSSDNLRGAPQHGDRDMAA